MVVTVIHVWYTNKMNYILAYPQDPVEREIYIHLPKGFKVVDSDTKDFV